MRVPSHFIQLLKENSFRIYFKMPYLHLITFLFFNISIIETKLNQNIPNFFLLFIDI